VAGVDAQLWIPVGWVCARTMMLKIWSLELTRRDGRFFYSEM
jgi:hypothetical protein